MPSSGTSRTGAAEERNPGSAVQIGGFKAERLSFMEPQKKRMAARIKAAVLVLFVVTAVVIVRFTPLKGFLIAERLGLFLDNAGFLAPLAFMIVYAVGVCLFVPGTLLTTLGAAIFGPYFGFLYVWVGAMVGSSLRILYRASPGAGIRRHHSSAAGSGNTMRPLSETALLQSFTCALSISRLLP